MAAIELFSTSLINDANLVSYYRLENVNDSKGANNLTNNGSTTFVSGKFANASSLNGSSQSLTLASGSSFFTGVGDKAFSFWVNPTSQPGLNATFTMSSWGNATHRLIFRYQDTSGTKQIGLGDGASNLVVGTQTLSNSTWYNLVFNFTGTTVTTFVNGVQLGSNAVAITSAANGFSIGNQMNEASNWFPGLIDDYSIFSRTLTQSDINLINNGPVSAFSLIMGQL